MRTLRSVHRPASHEDLFVERYEGLRRHALWLVRHDTDAAEDLIQEAFVRFVRVRPDLDDLRSIDAYLLTTPSRGREVRTS